MLLLLLLINSLLSNPDSDINYMHRPLQFNYLSYELFRKKKSCQTPKKKKKKVDFGVLRTKVVENFSVRLQKKKKKKQALEIFIVRTKYSEINKL